MYIVYFLSIFIVFFLLSIPILKKANKKDKENWEQFQEKRKQEMLNFNTEQYNNVISSCIILIIITISILFIPQYFKQNCIYSIAMPKIVGQFSYDKEHNTISINGLENLINDKSASLGYAEIFCMIDNHKCIENRLSITNFDNKITMYPYYNEYEINYFSHNKLIIYDKNRNITGEIDLLAKTISFTTISILTNETRKIEILTDNEKISKLEKEIIRKYLKVKLFSFIH